MEICSTTRRLLRNHWSQHPRHLLLRSLQVLACVVLLHLQDVDLSCGVDPMTINIQRQDQFGHWHHYQSKQNQADAYRVAQHRVESAKKRHYQFDIDAMQNSLLRLQNR